jgi:23S rRNA (guanosine2251-2'-O)-methyltransferase
MGSEDRGVNPSVLKIVDEKAKLPMFWINRFIERISRLWCFLYEAVRQRN